MEDLKSKIESIISVRETPVMNAFKKDRSKLPPDADANAVFTYLGNADPTKDQAKYYNWIINMYCKGEFKLEDTPAIHDTIVNFVKFNRKLEVKELNQYKTLRQLYDALETHIDSADKKEKLVAQVSSGEYKYLINTPNFKAFIPQTEQAAIIAGEGTTWCTANEDPGKNMFGHYSGMGDLVVIFAGQEGKYKKFQFSYEGSEFMNRFNQPINSTEIEYLCSFPQYTDFLKYEIKKHYSVE